MTTFITEDDLPFRITYIKPGGERQTVAIAINQGDLTVFCEAVNATSPVGFDLVTPRIVKVSGSYRV